MAEKKQPVNASMAEFLKGPDPSTAPKVVASVSYDHDNGDLLIRVPAQDLTWENSRPTSNKYRRQFVLVGDSEGIPGFVLFNGETQPVEFSNPTLNLFFGRARS